MDWLLLFNIAFVGVAGGLAALVPAVVAASAMRSGQSRFPWTEVACWCAVLFGWFSFSLFILRPSAFGAPDLDFPRLQFPILFGGSVIAGSIFIFFHPSVRKRVAETPIHWPIALQTARLVGGAFLVWAAAGKADWTFALVAGVGDMIVGATAPAAAMIVARGGRWSRPVAYGHTLLGLADFGSAIFTAFAVGGALAWPGPLIPVYLVPLATLMHIWTLSALARTSRQ